MVKAEGPEKRRYATAGRAQKAAETRLAILAAARALFVSKGYFATSIADIAREAKVNPDTVYASAGRKPELLRALIEQALSGTNEAVPAQERDYVAAIRAAAGAREKLAIYARALVAIQGRLAPIFLCLAEAAPTDAACAALWAEISARRANNMREFARDLRRTGSVRADLSDDEVADIVWALNGPEHYQMLVRERGWTPERFGRWLEDAWVRVLLG